MKITRFQDIPEFTRDGNWAADYSLDSAVRTVQEWMVEPLGVLDIDPDFQRAHVWTEAQQIAWLEYYFRGGKSGKDIYFNHPGWQRSFKGEFVVVDGKQRLNAAMRFMNNEVRVFGSYFNEFTDKMRVSGSTLRFHVNTLQTRAEVLQWYIEFNAGGTPHTDEEIAKAQALLDKEKATKRGRK